ncbi:hypothetical protein L7F22_015644 [Adiantum nelumboides]|nr:hypothetical protein [Adiantum nelumboides]
MLIVCCCTVVITSEALLSKSTESVVEAVIRRDPHEVEYVQAVQEVVHCLEPVLAKYPQYVQVLERFLEPERVILFRVPWIDDKGEAHINRGFRVQFNQSLGPYRGGLRFHPNVYLGVMKVLGFEQTMKNALAAYGLGGAGGGSDFDPKGKTENEVMRFCQSYMQELYTYLGPSKDYPSEDIGVGPREISYLFGQYKRLSGRHEGIFSGPRNLWSGFNMRTEATGYGLVHFAKILLADFSKDIRGLRCIVSGSGKVALHVVEKLIAVGAVPVTVSGKFSADYKYCICSQICPKVNYHKNLNSSANSKESVNEASIEGSSPLLPRKGASLSTRSSNGTENDPISKILDLNTTTISTTEAMIIGYLVSLQDTQGKDLRALVMVNGTVTVLVVENEHLKEVLAMQTTCLMQLEHEI